MKIGESYTKLRVKLFNELEKLIDKKGKESEYFSNRVLKIDNENLQFNLSNNHYLEEISKSYLISNNGYTYSFDCLEFEKLCKILDYYEKL